MRVSQMFEFRVYCPDFRYELKFIDITNPREPFCNSWRINERPLIFYVICFESFFERSLLCRPGLRNPDFRLGYVFIKPAQKIKKEIYDQLKLW